jgi:hypothetical protein
MWIITTRGFLSVVQNADAKASHEALLVRGRVRADLDHFADFVARHGDQPAVTATLRLRLPAHHLAPDIRGHRG